LSKKEARRQSGENVMTGVLIREIEIERDELLRLMPKAAGDFGFEVAGDGVILREGDKRVDVKLVYEGSKEGGPSGAQVRGLHFMFENMSDEQARVFMEHWDSILPCKSGT
jgi:hypothetical protein